MNPVLRHAATLAAIGMLALSLAACNGDDGATGPAGPSGTAECFGCHTDDFTMANFIVPIQTEFGESVHENGETYVRRSGSCSRCHTNEGFQTYAQTGVSPELTESSPIGCFTCHAPHSNGDFTLRAEGPTTLLAGGTFDQGASNLCAECHQARAASPAIGDGVAASGRWGTHHGPQANVLSGQGAYVFPGATYSSNASHKGIDNGCVECHMSTPPGSGLAGGHSFKMEYEYHGATEINAQGGCVDCHDEWLDDDELATTDVEAAKAAFEADLVALMTRMGPTGLGWFSTDDIAEAGGSILVSGTYDSDQLGAVWNFRMLAEDRSGGIHNPVYSADVLEATLAYVNSLP